MLEGHELRIHIDGRGRVAFGAKTPEAVCALESFVNGTWVETEDGTPVFLVRNLHVQHYRSAFEIPGLCPVCGERVYLKGVLTTDGRLIGSCGDAFTRAQWNAA